MVQKICKRGVHSGNTLRASNSRFNRRYSRTSCLLRKSVNHNLVKTTILDDMNMNDDDVIYSLSKKGRWELPDMLKHSILAGEYKDSKSNVKLLVSHDIAKKSHTVGYYASKGRAKVESKKKTYFNGESVVATGTKQDAVASGDQQSILQIEVVYPSPLTCSVVHNPKYVGNCIDKPENGKGRKTKSNRQRQKLSVGKYCEELNDNFGDYDDEFEAESEIDEEASSYIYGNCKDETATCTELLEDIIFHAALMQSLCEAKNHNKKQFAHLTFSLETKDKKIYESSSSDIDKEEEEPFQGEVTTTSTFVKRMDPVFVVIPKTEVEGRFLSERYGNKYKECPCYPRKFLIDTTDRMKNRVKTSRCFKGEYPGTWDLTSCVVFSHDELDVNNTETHNVFRVCLNIGTDTEQFKILTLFDYFEGCIEDVLHRAVVFLDMMSIDGFAEAEKVPPKDIATVNFLNLNHSQKVAKEASFITRNALFNEIFKTGDAERENVAFDLGFECVGSKYCGVCFDEIEEFGKPGTALTSCGHWFCEECWVEHCRSRMNMGSVRILCPEHDCSEIVPESVLLTFMNVYEVLKLMRRALDIELEASDHTKWCPNPYCSRVIKVTNPEKAKDLVCECGTHICFQCLQPSHWPIPCDHAPNYWEKLKRNGDDYIKIASKVTVRGKPCPKCKRFVEKIGGCFYMSCACGASFCWGCLGMYPGHTHTPKCIQYGQNSDLKGTKSIAVSDLDSYASVSKEQKSSYYKKAVNHRKARHPMKVNKLKAGIRVIKFKCRNIAKRKGPLYFSMFSEEEHTEEKVQDLLSNVLSIYIELHHIAEYSFVLLEKLNQIGTKCSQFRSTVECFGYYADLIFELITNSGNAKDFRPLIASLLHVQQKSARLTKTAVQLTKKFIV